MSRLTIHLAAQIPSGKNQQMLDLRGKYPRRYPNPRFEAWREDAAREIQRQRKHWPAHDKMATPLRGRVKLTVRYQPRDKRRRDVPGMLDALFHLLEYVELIEDDSQIQELDWWTFTDTLDEMPCVTMIVED